MTVRKMFRYDYLPKLVYLYLYIFLTVILVHPLGYDHFSYDRFLKSMTPMLKRLRLFREAGPGSAFEVEGHFTVFDGNGNSVRQEKVTITSRTIIIFEGVDSVPILEFYKLVDSFFVFKPYPVLSIERMTARKWDSTFGRKSSWSLAGILLIINDWLVNLMNKIPLVPYFFYRFNFPYFFNRYIPRISRSLGYMVDNRDFSRPVLFERVTPSQPERTTDTLVEPKPAFAA